MYKRDRTAWCLRRKHVSSFSVLCKALEALGKWNPPLSTTCALDEHEEAGVTARLEALAPKISGVIVASAEHDGVTFFDCKPEVVLRQVADSIPEYRFDIKPLDHPMMLAKVKHPEARFGQKATMATQEFFDCCPGAAGRYIGQYGEGRWGVQARGI